MTYQHAPLGDLASLQAGYGFPLELQGRTTGDYPFAKVGDISRCGRSTSSVLGSADHYVDANDLSVLRAKPIPAGSVIFAKIGEAIRQNHRVIAGCDMLIDNNAMAAVPTEKIDGRFLYHFLKTVDFYSLASATTVPALRKSDLEMLPTPCPPLPEQRRIAAILDKADALRAKRREALAQLDRLAQSIFLEMFGDPVTNPKGWRRLQLGQIFGIARGGSPRPIDDYITDAADGVNWVMIGDTEQGGKYIWSTKKKIRPEGVKRSRLVKSGDFLLTNSMSFGRPYIMKTGGCIHDGWLVLSSQINDFHADYFYALLGSQALFTEFSKRAAGATVKNLNIDLVAGVGVAVPPIEEQRKFAKAVEAIETMKSHGETSASQLDSLFGSLQVRAFSGEL